MKKIKILVAIGATFFGSIAMSQCNLSNLDVWTSFNNSASMLDVTAGAAMGGACGLKVTVSNQVGGQSIKHFVQDSSPAGELRYRAAFCIDPNSVNFIDASANRRLKVHMAQCSGGSAVGCSNTDVVQFKLENPTESPTGYQFRMYVRDLGTNNTRNTHTIPIGDEPTRVEYDINLSNNTFKVWINATAETDTPVVDLDAADGLDLSGWSKIDRIRLGTMDKSTNVTAGDTFYIDNFESRRQTFIGGTCL